MKLFIIICSFLLFAQLASTQIPQQNLIFWVNSNGMDTLNGRLQEWIDQSAQNNNAIQSNSGNQPHVIQNSFEWGGQTIIDFNRSNENFLSTISPVLNSTNFSNLISSLILIFIFVDNFRNS